MFSLVTYILLIVGVNWAFSVTPAVPLPNGEAWAPLSLIVGFIFVVRDFAQRRVGHRILWGMLAGCAISWKMASPELALASAAAFAVSELADWTLFTLTRKPLSSRILLSGFIAAPLDSLVFLWLIGLAAPLSFLTMTASKLAGSLLVFLFLRRRENPARTAQGNA
ncbi:MAG: hypothetical protein LBC94_08380 [Desulfovibrio sp.]|jgi:uncharacterized PurR-regulated membrane protein YhhQ (DUF165 family)|nr:hypothetical protein [Desulfovibrio sp.]